VREREEEKKGVVDDEEVSEWTQPRFALADLNVWNDPPPYLLFVWQNGDGGAPPHYRFQGHRLHWTRTLVHQNCPQVSEISVEL